MERYIEMTLKFLVKPGMTDLEVKELEESIRKQKSREDEMEREFFDAFLKARLRRDREDELAELAERTKLAELAEQAELDANNHKVAVAALVELAESDKPAKVRGRISEISRPKSKKAKTESIKVKELKPRKVSKGRRVKEISKQLRSITMDQALKGTDSAYVMYRPISNCEKERLPRMITVKDWYDYLNKLVALQEKASKIFLENVELTKIRFIIDKEIGVFTSGGKLSQMIIGSKERSEIVDEKVREILGDKTWKGISEIYHLRTMLKTLETSFRRDQGVVVSMNTKGLGGDDDDDE